MMRGDWGHPGIQIGHHWDGVGIAGMVLMIILWVAVITAIVLVVRALIIHAHRNRIVHAGAVAAGAAGPSAPPAPVAPPATQPALLGILEERYARGELNRDEFLQRKQDLGLSGTPEPPAGVTG
jgi:putative membrane protein